ncbi:hypothetical protein DACRYDRAFT_23415 [Dacryopinax primogenitus]|uniref:Uncharacterized protein n=1 Tax=Dacryopinax primogenitus (strain DJM 731) TaxID=1858805 RepID=M5FUE8_DACPD|nr:uncharacterized protein DACRYDRAFT_23415 [Dacryopinax primogenitus]EJT99848.1 hypothetical protein DACRYDRAFT_23415 [Dacryopinax primogenitus]
MMHLLLLLTSLIVVRASQPGATQSSAWPARPLVWGDVNFLFTTDTHGWLMGHTKSGPPEPNYSADFGDFLSFTTHMKSLAAEKGVDLLLIDSGDLHDGTGLTDGAPPGQPNAHESNKFIMRLPYDVLTPGNHELYQYASALDTYKSFVPHWSGKYISSNVHLTLPNTTNLIPFGSPYRKFLTTQGRRVTAFGVLFHFTMNARGTQVQSVEELVEQPWFAQAVEEEPDMFVVAGHMPVHMEEDPEVNVNDWPIVYYAIRQRHPETAIFIFGGHSHKRNCTVMDEHAIAIQGGRYMETVGWLSANLTEGGGYTRRYLDTNRNTYQYHTGTDEEDFDTLEGIELTQYITQLADVWNLHEVFGYAPQDWYLDRVEFPHKNSVLTLFLNDVLPTVLRLGAPERSNIPLLAIFNRGSIRYDIYQGPFTRNDQYTVMPFKNQFFYVTVPWAVGRRVVDEANKKREDQARLRDAMRMAMPSLPQPSEVPFPLPGAQTVLGGPKEPKEDEPLTLGYVTQDLCEGYADDTPHLSIGGLDRADDFHSSPPLPISDDTLMDVVFPSFVAQPIVDALNRLFPGQNYTVAGLEKYMKWGSEDVFEVYAREKWN